MNYENCVICGKEFPADALRSRNMFDRYSVCDEHYELIANAVTDLIESLAEMYTLAKEET